MSWRWIHIALTASAHRHSLLLKDDGQARQITLFAHREAALEILTSDFDARPAEIPSWLKSRWREENFLKYASESYGIGKTATNRRDQPNSKIAANPARQPATAMSSAADILSGFCTGGYLDNPG